MTKFQKQIILVSVLVVLAIVLTVVYLKLNPEETESSAPVLEALLEDDKIVISGLDPEKSYLYSRDNKNWIEVKKDSSTLVLESGKMCYVKEDSKNSEPVAVGPFGETTKNLRPYIVDTIENKDMNSIFVHNTLDEYTLIHKKSGAYKLEGLDGFNVNEEMLASLRVNALNLLALRFVDKVTKEEMLDYGIDADNPENYFVVTYNNEKDSYKILLGDKTPDSDGFYAVLEGRDALYVVDTGVEGCILKARRDYVKPNVVRTIDNSHKFTLVNFALNKKGEKYIAIDIVKDSLTYGNNSSHRVTYPAYNYATNLTNFETFLNTLISLNGSQTLLYGEEITKEALEELGFFDEEGNDTSDYSFTYKFPAFSEALYVMKNEDGSFMAYSKEAKLVARVEEASLAFLDWDMLNWISSEVYLLDIENVAKMTFEASGEIAEFTLSGEAQDLSVKVNDKVANIDEFKELYRSILYVIVTAYAEPSTAGDEALRITVELESGEVLDYRFYRYSAQNMFYTLNGFGEFYVSADKVNEVKQTALGFIY